MLRGNMSWARISNSSVNFSLDIEFHFGEASSDFCMAFRSAPLVVQRWDMFTTEQLILEIENLYIWSEFMLG